MIPYAPDGSTTPVPRWLAGRQNLVINRGYGRPYPNRVVPRTVLGRTMTGLELSADAGAQVVVDGQVSPDRSLAQCDTITAVFSRALKLLPVLDG